MKGFLKVLGTEFIMCIIACISGIFGILMSAFAPVSLDLPQKILAMIAGLILLIGGCVFLTYMLCGYFFIEKCQKIVTEIFEEEQK